MDKEDTSLLPSENPYNDDHIHNDTSNVPSLPIANSSEWQSQQAVAGQYPTNLCFVTCSKCSAFGPQLIKTKSNAKKHYVAGLFFILGLWFFTPLPYITEACKTRYVYCRDWNKFLSTYQRN